MRSRRSLDRSLLISFFRKLQKGRFQQLSLIGLHLLVLVKSTEVVCGLLLLANRWVPLALTVVAPIAVNILAFHLFADSELLPLGILVAALVLVLFWSYRHFFLGLLQPSSAPSMDHDL